MMFNLPFNKPYTTLQDFDCIQKALEENQLVGDGSFTKKCHTWLEKQTNTQQALLTHSCTGALEMAALLIDIKPDDEVILPSYTFSSTANAFALRGAVPVFIDIRSDTLNIDENLIEQAITSKTKAIIPVHYAGVACEMDTMCEIAQKYNLAVVEDAAQGVHAFYKGKSLGAIGDIGAYSFHGTKNIVCGEGGAILINNKCYLENAEIIREKGTDRNRFIQGFVDKYTWQEIGSSFLPSDITAAFLLSQLEQAEYITAERLKTWNSYHECFKDLEVQGFLRRPFIPSECQHNAHMYYVLLNHKIDRQSVIAKLKEFGISAVTHYVPLHSSPAGMRHGRVVGSMKNTNVLSDCVVRLPLWVGLTCEQISYVYDCLKGILKNEI